MKTRPAKKRTVRLQSREEIVAVTEPLASPVVDGGQADRPVSRHTFSGCRVCPHKNRAEVEKAFVNWRSLREIAQDFGVSKDSVARHAEALGLDERRAKNVRAALTRVVEKGFDTAAISGSALVAALGVLSKLDAAGQQIDRVEVHAKIASLFPRMSDAELEAFAETGGLPTWIVAAGEAATGEQANWPEDPHEHG